MGHKWLEAFSKAVTYLGSGVTALTGTMQAAQQQEQGQQMPQMPRQR